MTKLLQTLVAIGILSSIPILANSYAEICQVNCEAPTLGVITNGQRIVDNGLVINGRTFTVEENIQSIPTMTFNTGKVSEIKLNVYEDGGTDFLRHASISISDYGDDQNRNDLATISFDQDFTGEQSTTVVDPNGIFTNVNTKMTLIDDFNASVEFSFKSVKPFDKSSLIVQLWDDERSSRTNVFLGAVQATGNEVIEFVPEPSVYVPTPLQQVNDGVSPEDVECRAGLELVIRTTGSPACVYPFTAETLRAWGLVE
ncbi:MAG: hypothetical protein ACT4OD_04885 [Candidatus Nitrosotenuis sp.]